MNKKAKHFWNELIDGDITNWELKQISKGETKCACGTPIKNIYLIENKITFEKKVIGCDCANKLGFKLKWKSKSDYLANAYLMASNSIERQFVRQQQDKLPKWGEQLILSQKQIDWLEKITNKKWKGKAWKVKA